MECRPLSDFLSPRSEIGVLIIAHGYRMVARLGSADDLYTRVH